MLIIFGTIYLMDISPLLVKFQPYLIPVQDDRKILKIVSQKLSCRTGRLYLQMYVTSADDQYGHHPDHTQAAVSSSMLQWTS
jgi:hypothetical protein